MTGTTGDPAGDGVPAGGTVPAGGDGLPGDGPKERTYRSGRRLVPVFGALMLGMFLAALDQTIVGTALPTIVSEFGGLAHISWVITAYLLAATVSTPLWGKLGDQYGRKGLFQVAIVVFLIGSALCGLAQGMVELIAFRALQGLGGGGLMVLAMAIVGDIVPPRERGKYQGVFGAVFGVSAVLGPLLGGFFTDGPGWRWVFYINLPLGVLALVVIGFTLQSRQERHRHRIDYAGTLVLAVAAAALVLATSWGGTEFSWGSPVIIGLFVVAVVGIAVWIPIERRAAEPVLPLSMFRLGAFRTTAILGLIVGFAMLGVLTFLPLYLQVVHGTSPTASGLHLLPMVIGMLIMSVGSGQLISRTGHYKVFPIAGAAVMVVGLFLLSTMDPTTTLPLMSLYFFVFGAGLGSIMQVLVIIVQNAVDYADLGAATSGVTFFRSIGGSFGTAVFGTIFANLLAGNMGRALAGRQLPPGVDPTQIQENREVIGSLPTALRDAVLAAYSESITAVFGWAIPVVLLGFVVAWFVPELPLRTTVTVPEPSRGVPGLVSDADPRHELERQLSVLLQRDERARSAYVRLGDVAGVELSAGAIWALGRIGHDGTVSRDDLADRAGVTVENGRPYIDELIAHRLVIRVDDRLAVTAGGWQAYRRLIDARRRALDRHLAGWSRADHPELTEILDRLASETIADQPAPRSTDAAA